MDPISQAALGSAVAGCVAWHGLKRWSLAVGAVGGALADIDVLWGGLGDPALPWELHRHFTHAYAFIPLGALIAALPFWFIPSLRSRRGLVFFAAFAAYATHGALDACTAWGTYIYWPFDSGRASWDIISVVDPLFTIPLLAGIAFLLRRPSRLGVAANGMGLALALSYCMLGVWQHERAWVLQRSIAEQRGHQLERGRVMPTLGNLILWRSLYQVGDQLYADALRLLPWESPTFRAGEKVMRYRIEEMRLSPRQRDILGRFQVFADGYLAIQPDGLIGDQRYSYKSAGFEAIWGLKLGGAEIYWNSPAVERSTVWSRLRADLFEGQGFVSQP